MQKLFFPFFTYFGIILLLSTIDIFTSHISPSFYTQNFTNILLNWKELSLIKSYGIPISNSVKFDYSFYVSHPPFSYYFFYIFNIVLGVKNFFWINLSLVSASGYFMYLTLSRLMQYTPSERISYFAMAGGLIYISQPGVVHMQLYQLHPDIFLITLQIIFVYISIKMLSKNRTKSLKYQILLVIVTFLMSYSSWLGLLYTFALAIIGLFNLRKEYKMIPIILLIVSSGALALLMMYIQYAQYEHWWTLIKTYRNIYLNESFRYLNFFEGQLAIFRYHSLYLWHYYLVFVVLGVITFRRQKIGFQFTKNGYRYLLVSALPVAMLYAFLYRYAQNEYIILYTIPPFTTILIVWLEKLVKNQLTPLFYSVVGFMIVANLLTLYLFNSN